LCPKKKNTINPRATFENFQGGDKTPNINAALIPSFRAIINQMPKTKKSERLRNLPNPPKSEEARQNFERCNKKKK